MDKRYYITKNINAKRMKLIKEMAEDMGKDELLDFIIKENIHNPWDISFRSITTKYPKEAHEVYGFPGKFVKALDTKIITEDGTNLEMDYSSLVLPDDIIPEKSTINVEHQSTLPTQDKIKTIYKYKLHLVMTHRLPALNAIISPYKIKNKYYKTHGDLLKILQIGPDEGELHERLNILKNKITNSKKLTRSEALQFTYIATFTPKENGKEMLNILAELFTQTELTPELRMDIFFVLKTMIKTYFKDDEKKLRELLKMIIETIPKPDYKNMSLYGSVISAWGFHILNPSKYTSFVPPYSFKFHLSFNTFDGFVFSFFSTIHCMSM